MARSRPRLRLAVVGLVAMVVVAPTAGTAAQDILSDPGRPEADRERDPGSKPLEVFAWLGIEPGMVVGDVVPGGGYNTHVLALLVGDSGRVHAVGTSADSAAALEARLRAAGIANTAVHQRFTSVPDASIDAYISIRNVHDMLIPDIAEQYGMQPDPIFREMLRTLKPGGIVGIVDVRTPGDGVDSATHRVSESLVIAELEARGLEYLERSELLANPDDDPSDGAWNGRPFTDRLLLKFRKPMN